MATVSDDECLHGIPPYSCSHCKNGVRMIGRSEIIQARRRQKCQICHGWIFRGSAVWKSPRGWAHVRHIERRQL